MKIDDVVSPTYRATLVATHKEYRMKWGGGGRSWSGEVEKWAAHLECKTILDYGCGRGTLKEALEGKYPVAEFDPGIPGKDTLPQGADLVVATDVLEHIEPNLVESVLWHMGQLAHKGAFFVIALTPAKLTLTDGRNAHLTLQSPKWWTDQLEAAGFDVEKTERRKGLVVWAN